MQVSRNANCTKPYYKAKASMESKLPSQYLYHRSFYQADHLKIRVLCKSHGFFNETPTNLSKGALCPQCVQKKTLEDRFMYKGKKYSSLSFVKEVRLINGHKYTYDNNTFKGFHKTMKVLCPLHRYFNAKPHHHLSPGALCPHCRGMRKT